MLRALIFIIILLGLGYGAVWFYEHPGSVGLIWLGYEVYVGVGLFTSFILGVSFLLALLIWLLGRIISLPSLLVRRYGRYKRRRGLEQLTEVLSALGGENKERARKLSTRIAESLCGGELSNLGILLRADSALLSGHSAAARKDYERLLVVGSDDGALIFSCYRGLAILERRSGRYDEAIRYGLEAQSLDDGSVWARRFLADLYEMTKDYESAIGALQIAEKRNLWSKSEISARIVDLYVRLAKSCFASGDMDGVLRYVDLARRRDKSHIEMLSLLSKVCVGRGEYDKAEKALKPLLERDLKTALKIYGDILRLRLPVSDKSDDVYLRRLQQAEKYLSSFRSSVEVLHFWSALCMDAEVWGKARSYLESVTEAKYDLRHCHLMVRLERSVGDTDLAASWLERACSLSMTDK